MYAPTEHSDDVMSEINMTPLVDVMLVLLIIFIITMPVVNHAVALNLPQASTQNQKIQPTEIYLSIRADGQLHWNQNPISTEQLSPLALESAKQAHTQIHVRADKTTTYQQIATVMAQLQNAGVVKVSLVTTPH